MELVNQISRSYFVFSHTWKYLQLAKSVQANISDLKSRWTKEILEHLNIELEIIGEPSAQTPILFLGNHISYLDIVLVLKACPNISFVSKKEVGDWPIIGTAARKLETTFVKRESKKSRKEARTQIQNALLMEQKRIVLFPSGTTSINESTSWRLGPFEIAKEINIPIQPFRISYDPLRASAFIDEDILITHLMKLTSLRKIKAQIEFHEPLEINDLETCRNYCQNWASRKVIPPSEDRQSLAP